LCSTKFRHDSEYILKNQSKKEKARKKRRTIGSEIKTKRHEITQGKVGGRKKFLGGFGYATTDQVLV